MVNNRQWKIKKAYFLKASKQEQNSFKYIFQGTSFAYWLIKNNTFAVSLNNFTREQNGFQGVFSHIPHQVIWELNYCRTCFWCERSSSVVNTPWQQTLYGDISSPSGPSWNPSNSPWPPKEPLALCGLSRCFRFRLQYFCKPGVPIS